LAPCGAGNVAGLAAGGGLVDGGRVLSRGKVTPSSVSYYTDTVAAGVEDYYAGRGEAAGEWVGNGSAAAGLQGEVSGEQVRGLFEGIHPVTGELLGRSYRVRAGADRVTGWDLTFSAPKSVSALWAVAGGEVGMEVREAHDAAVRAALAYLEEHAAFSRQGKAGIRQVDTDGLVGAAFVHRTSRAGDPQLHTHVLVSGRVRCTDGEWRALDSRALHRQLKPAGVLYQAALRAELSARLGVEWSEVDRHGQAEIDGVPEGLRRHYSSRRQQVEVRARERIAEVEVERGRALTPEERRQVFEKAVLATRAAKQVDDTADDGLHDRWRDEAARVGQPAESWVSDTVARPLSRAGREPNVVVEVLDELVATRSTFARGDVVQQVARRVPLDIGTAEDVRAWVEVTVEDVLGHGAVVCFGGFELEVPEALRRRDGRSVFEPHGAARYTTTTTLAIEQYVLDTALAGREAGRAVVSAGSIEETVTGAGLGPDQVAAVARCLGGGDAVVCVVGPAGTGKSRAMGAAAAAWQANAIPIRGLALSATAAGVLRDEAGIDGDTIAKFLFEQDRPNGPEPGWRLQPGEVVIVDEAGMVATRDLARLLHCTEQVGGKLVLVGDHAQLGAIDAGGMFRLLAADTNANELHEVHRFTHEWEAAASLALRDRKTDALDAYEAHDRIIGGDRLAGTDDAFTRWHHARQQAQSVVVIAADHDTVDAFSRRARAARVEHAEVEPGGLLLGAQVVGAGDEIVTLRNDRRLLTGRDGWVRNGDRWVIDARHEDGSLTVSDLTGRGRVRLPADYVAEHVTLGYALTPHKAQGVTVDHGVLIADDTLSAETLYVAMSRGRISNTAFVVVDPLDIDAHRPLGPTAARAVLTAALHRPSAERAALEHLRAAQHRTERLDVLAPRLANLEHWIAEHMPPDVGQQLDRARQQLEDATRAGKPGRKTRARRDNRLHLQALNERVEVLDAARQQREGWLIDHADNLQHRDHLRAHVDRRRRLLGEQAAHSRPAHVLELLGEPTTTGDAEPWIEAAGRIEAYREEWHLRPEQILEPPDDRTQRAVWQDAIKPAIDSRRFERWLAGHRGPSLEHEGPGIEL
jgi:conjugative relaxase-like TrwC/TraI family protein